MKRAFFVIGAESSGTRVLTRAFISAGCWGNGGHVQRLDARPKFDVFPDLIVFRRSLPHFHGASRWFDVGEIQENIKNAGYELTTVAIMRDPAITALSQTRDNQHADTLKEAEANIEKATRIIGLFADEFIHYHTFVTDAWYRKEKFDGFGLPEPDMEFYDGNWKYEHLL